MMHGLNTSVCPVRVDANCRLIAACHEVNARMAQRRHAPHFHGRPGA